MRRPVACIAATNYETDYKETNAVNAAEGWRRWPREKRALAISASRER